MLRVSSDLTRPAFSPATGSNSNGRSLPFRERGLFGLAPGGVYPATPIAQGTGELLPRLFTLTLWNRRHRHSTGRSVFCGTFLTPCEMGFHFTRDSPRYGPPCPVELGLSSPPVLTLRVVSGGATICSSSTSPLSLDLNYKSLITTIKDDYTDKKSA